LLEQAQLVKQLTGHCCGRRRDFGTTCALLCLKGTLRLPMRCVAFIYSTSQPKKAPRSVLIDQDKKTKNGAIDWIMSEY
jgi:hypothetical protein